MKRRCLLKTLALVTTFLFVGVEMPSMVGVTKEEAVFTSFVSGGYIQDLIDNASDGDTIYISSGIYYENIIINKSISLVGEDKNTTIIDGGENGYVIDVNADRVNISGFTIQNSGYDNWNYAGIRLYSYYNNISGNLILNNSHGIIGDLNNCIITNNIIANNHEYGLELYGNNNSISGNIITKNELGIDLFSVENNNILYNTISNNNFSGIKIDIYSNYNNIVNNTISNNNNSGMDIKSYTFNNSIYHNNFINNTINAIDRSNNIWYNMTVLEGNHWSNYNGTDENNDGIGDKPYNISGGSNQDLYPLIHPFENYSILQIIIPNIPFFEDDDVPIFVFSLANLPIKDAIVQFNNQTSLTDSNGTIWLTAPQVQMDKYYEIKATKTGYTSADEKILIRNMPSNFKYGFIFGKIVNITGTNKVIVFEAFNVTVVTFRPFMISQYTSGKEFIISYNYEGWIGYLFVFAFCKILI